MQTQKELLNTFTYTDSELAFENCNRYMADVSISAQRIGISISIPQRVLGYRYIQTNNNWFNASANEIKNGFEALEWLSHQYKQVRVFINNNLYTLVPEALFENDSTAEYLQAVHKVTTNHHVLTTSLQNKQTVCVFALPKTTLTAIKQIVNPSVISHQCNCMIHLANQFNDSDLKHHLMVNIEADFISVLQYQQNEIQYFNTFSVETDTDIVYFILSVAEMLKLPKDKFGVYLLGSFSNTSATVQLLKKYVTNMHLMPRLQSVQYPIAMREVQDHQHYLPLHTLLCE